MVRGRGKEAVACRGGGGRVGGRGEEMSREIWML